MLEGCSSQKQRVLYSIHRCAADEQGRVGSGDEASPSAGDGDERMDAGQMVQKLQFAGAAGHLAAAAVMMTVPEAASATVATFVIATVLVSQPIHGSRTMSSSSSTAPLQTIILAEQTFHNTWHKSMYKVPRKQHPLLHITLPPITSTRSARRTDMLRISSS